MSSAFASGTWREPILAQFSREIAGVARLTVVADPDELLTEPGIIDGIRGRGFEIVPFEDHIAFRYAYEQRFREVWDNGKETTLVVLLRAPRSDISGLPYDLLKQAHRDGRLLSFSLGELFPALAPHVLAELDRTEFDAVAAAIELFEPGSMGENATRDFLLRNIFQLDPMQIQSDVDLLRALLRRHYTGRIIPRSLDARFIDLLRANGKWREWPLEEIVPSRASFLGFLQERWPNFVRQSLRAQGGGLKEGGELFNLQFSGPADLPFHHDDVRVYIDNLFTEGFLTPTRLFSRSLVDGTWLAVGVAGSDEEDRLSRFRKLLSLLDADDLSVDIDHHAWIRAATRWAEVVSLRWSLAESPALDEIKSSFSTAHHSIEQRFHEWLTAHYASLHSLSPLPKPVMLHQVARYMAHRLAGARQAAKLAVIVIDGLALDQWAVIRQHVPMQRWCAEESGVFAWIPTLTAVSRQSIFAGDPPFFFGQSLGTTAKEEQHWSRFWSDHGFKNGDVGYLCQGTLENDDDYLERVKQLVDPARCRIAGIVVGTLDQMLHGTVTGTDGLHASVRHWAHRGSLSRLVDSLIDRGFEVIITADHGNVEGVGIGKPNVGVTAEERGERVHVFSSELLRGGVAKSHPGSIEWPSIGLPENYLPLIAPALSAFIGKGKRTVAHGGACLEEVIVPFVTIARSE